MRGQQIAGRFAVADGDDLLAAEGEAGQGGQRALAGARVVPQAPAFGVAADRPDRELVADTHRLVPARGVTGGGERGHHAHDLVDVRFAPGWPEGVVEEPPVAGVAQGAVADAEGLALEEVGGLDQAGVRGGDKTVGLGDGLGGLLGALQRGGDDVRDIALREVLGDALGHAAAQLGEVVAGQASIEHTGGVFHLTVPHQVNDRLIAAAHISLIFGQTGRIGKEECTTQGERVGGCGYGAASAAARAAAGRAAAMRSRACSSCAVDTNHTSNAEGGR